ncbi:MAG: GNAT family N-acetyltransferase [Ectothiorhodospiraceae bacterium]|nr:GNAT family N-acetyltransferase [Chromatiales bacterium]MCP5157314.1 GNAT family N-acetyltransferase [Ectothiorhodospiraceae bacterium]
MAEIVDLRLGRSVDAGAIARMSRDLVEYGLPWRWTAGRVASHIRRDDSVVLVASRPSRLVGFAIMDFGGEHAHLSLLAVHPAFRRAGLGRRLLSWLEISAREAGLGVVFAEVRERNADARAFYARLGYRELHRLRHYYGPEESALRLGRDLWEARHTPSPESRQP